MVSLLLRNYIYFFMSCRILSQLSTNQLKFRCHFQEVKQFHVGVVNQRGGGGNGNQVQFEIQDMTLIGHYDGRFDSEFTQVALLISLCFLNV